MLVYARFSQCSGRCKANAAEHVNQLTATCTVNQPFFQNLLQQVQIQKGKSNLRNSSSCVVRLRDPVLQKKTNNWNLHQQRASDWEVHTSGVLTDKGCRHESGSCGLALRAASLLPEVTLEQAFKRGQKWIRAINPENTETSSYIYTCVLLYFQIISMLLQYPTATKTMWTPSCGTGAAGDLYDIYIIYYPLQHMTSIGKVGRNKGSNRWMNGLVVLQGGGHLGYSYRRGLRFQTAWCCSVLNLQYGVCIFRYCHPNRKYLKGAF